MRTAILTNALIVIHELRTGYCVQSREAERLYSLRIRICQAMRKH
jgi:hypothetical protein